MPHVETKAARRWLRAAMLMSATLLMGLPLCPSFASEYDPTDFNSLLAEAQQKGAVRVMVSLDVDVGFEAMRENGPLLRTVIPQKVKTLSDELGAEAWSAPRWDNGLGQVGWYVTAAGLRYLASTSNARSFTRDPTDKMRASIPGTGDRLGAIEAALVGSTAVDVEVTLNLASVDFNLAKNRIASFHSIDQMESANVRSALLGELNSRRALNLNAAGASSNASPQVSLKLTREGFYFLREHRLVRSMKLAGHVDQRPTRMSSKALAEAQRSGYADVIVELRTGDAYSANRRHLPERAWKNQKAAMQRAFAEILAGNGITPRMDFSEVGARTVRASHAALLRLYEDPDPRILSIRLHEPLASTGLATSTTLTNMASAWNAGYRATGQNIVIFDSGIKKSHEIFKMGGISKVFTEFCAGTNSGVYRSICPAKNNLGDSPLGYVGSGEPVALASCPKTSSNYGQCTHGTHVAGIAAGRPSTSLPSGVQGIALDAGLVSAQVFSFDPSNVAPPAVFAEDLWAGLQAVYDNTTTDNYVVNMSLWWSVLGTFVADCTDTDATFELMVSLLHGRNIPVVIITGNGGATGGISWPACTPNTIKVAGTNNSGTGNVVNANSNVGNPALFSGGFVLAPGFNVVSATMATTTSTASYGGTSMAAPHVSGYYAAIKDGVPGISIADATAWIVSTGSVPVTYSGRTYRRIKAPAF